MLDVQGEVPLQAARGGSPSNFLNRAMPFVELGIRIFPLIPKGKVPIARCGFTREATTDLSKLKDWNDGDPNRNVALLATNDTVCFLEFDIPNGVELMEAEMGQKLPNTRMQRSGAGGTHVVGFQTDRTRKVGNRSVNLKEPCTCTKIKNGKPYENNCNKGCIDTPHHHHEWFSFRQHNKYIVGAGSIHPNGNIYQTSNDSAIQPWADWVMDFVEKHSVPEKPAAEPYNAQSVSDEFDFDDMIDEMDIGVIHNDDPWVIVECPGVDRMHEGSKRTGFYWDGETLGWHCFAQGCPCSDDNLKEKYGISGIGGFLMFMADKAREEGREPYRGRIWDKDDSAIDEFAEEIEDVTEHVVASVDVGNGVAAAPAKAPEQEVCKLCKRTDEQGCLCGKWTSVSDVVMPEPEKRTPEAKAEEPQPEPVEIPPSVEHEPEENILVGKDKNGNPVYVSVTNMGMVIPRKVTWLWEQKVIRNYVTIFSGKPEQAKSLCTMDIAARVTTGRDFPDGSKNTLGPKNVLVLASEDGLSDVMWARLTAAGADLSRVDVVRGVVTKTDKLKKRMVALKDDGRKIQLLIQEKRKQGIDIALLIVDPISSYLGADINKAKEAKPVLDELKLMCERLGIAFIIVAHYSKRSDVDALQQIAGDVSIGGSCRVSWSFAKDPEKEGEFLMTNGKGNHNRDKSGMRYKVVGVDVKLPNGEVDNAPLMMWLDTTKLSAQDVQDKQKELARNRDAKVDKFKQLLLTLFPAGKYTERSYKEVYAEATKEGLGEGESMTKGVQRAKAQLTQSGERVIQGDDRRPFGKGFWMVHNPGFKPEPQMSDTAVM